ncbi:urease accessory protein UreF [Caenimonas koreensis]|nr:urease accessory UreF family protein [Caenimonas koreensis]
MVTTTTLTDDALLSLIWLASPALPVGGFSYSEGLEAAVEGGHVTDETTASEWLAQQLHLTLARADLGVIAQAVDAFRVNDIAQVRELDQWILQTRETSELRAQTEQMGRSLGEWMRTLDASNSPQAPQEPNANWTYPIAFALAASRGAASTRAILLAFTFGWAENMMQSAIKSIPLGQSSGQRILARLAREIPAAVDHALQLSADARQAFSPMLAILSAQHETQYSRLFRS